MHLIALVQKAFKIRAFDYIYVDKSSQSNGVSLSQSFLRWSSISQPMQL